MTILLFAYGTLAVPQVQKALFGKTLKSHPACLENWGRFMGDDGYLFVKPAPFSRVSGHVLHMTSEDLYRADLWEDLTQYTRLTGLAVADDGKKESVFFYAKPQGQGRPWNSGEQYGLDLSDILADIRRLVLTDNGQAIRGCRTK